VGLAEDGDELGDDDVVMAQLELDEVLLNEPELTIVELDDVTLEVNDVFDAEVPDILLPDVVELMSNAELLADEVELDVPEVVPKAVELLLEVEVLVVIEGLLELIGVLEVDVVLKLDVVVESGDVLEDVVVGLVVVSELDVKMELLLEMELLVDDVEVVLKSLEVDGVLDTTLVVVEVSELLGTLEFA
jgi:hypothetical protein